MNKRKLRLDKYGISNKRYKELCGFCEQYPEWLEELKSNTDTVKSSSVSGMPASSSGSGDPTSALARRRAELRKRCELIEQMAIQANADLYQYIIRSVCYEEPFWYLRDIKGMPCSQRSFYDYRRYFFYLLDQSKEM